MVTKQGARTKGYFKRIDNSQIFKFQLNPTTVSTSRGANYSEIQGCGSSYPILQYGGGEVEKITFTLDIFESVNGCKEAISYLEGLMPSKNPLDRFKLPPVFYFSFGGSFTEKCVLQKLDKTHQNFNSNLETTEVSFNIELVVVK